jgi:hypothetical protein
MSRSKVFPEVRAIGAKAQFSGMGAPRVGTIAGHAVIRKNGAAVFAYIIDLGDDNGFYSPGRDTYVSMLVVAADNLDEVRS